MKALLALFLAATFSAPTFATPALLDFQDPAIWPFLNGYQNFNYKGLRFSPPCNIHIGHTHNPPGQVYLQSDHDNSNCEGRPPNGENDPYGIPNPNYVDPEFKHGFPDFHVDKVGGGTFTLLGLAGAGHVGTAFHVYSSKGGHFYGEVPWDYTQDPYVLPWKAFTLFGPLWTNIEWFTLVNVMEGFGWQPHQGWDDIRYCDGSVYTCSTISEPAPLTLIGIALVGMAFIRRRRMSIS